MSNQHYKTLPDGSIDYEYYTVRGRRMREEATHELFADICSVIGSLAALLIGRTASKGSHTGTGPAASATTSAKPGRYVWRVG